MRRDGPDRKQARVADPERLEGRVVPMGAVAGTAALLYVSRGPLRQPGSRRDAELKGFRATEELAVDVASNAIVAGSSPSA